MAVQVETYRASRSLWKAVGNGIACRCPNCGKGKLFRAYLKLNQTCANCGLDLSSARADDFPPYIAIFIVGHVLVGWMLHAEMSGPSDPMLYVLTMIPAAILLPLVMLPSIKGAVVGLQWANYMYGFDPARTSTEIARSDV
ncbi:DUF983 domain-containing protein [Devosia sp.]|uniref:DUF983 domain-containing protein n=1 Tax=Devosia sp. TaxID=1871048 RepID=UPI001AC66B69|nr:DUF983 domain-containing protein [Devosia sp.]MBN9309763.1 DUF983 domain-containing protein [Devosia sp.]